MSAKPPPRSILKMIFNNFWNSLRPRQLQGTYKGEDYFGNKYYEIPANPAIGKRNASRWFEPAVKDKFDQERTAEWDAWLRGRRVEPPTRDELIQNLSIMEMKKINAAKIDEKFKNLAIEQNSASNTSGVGAASKEKAAPNPTVTGISFPSYTEYELSPGQNDKDK